MSLSYVVDGFTELDSELFNPIIDRVNGDAGPLANMRVGIYNVRDYGAAGDGVTDDTEAIQAAINAAVAAGKGVVDGAGRAYRISLRDTITEASFKYALMVHGDHIKFRNMTIVRRDSFVNGHSTIMVSGQAKAAASYASADMYAQDINFNPNVYKPIYPIEEAAYLDGSIRLVNESDNVNFAVGDWIYPRAGQTIPVAGEAQPDSEYNRVAWIDGPDIGLVWPLAKNYLQEYFPDAGRDDATTTDVTAYPAFLGVVNANECTIDGFDMEDVHFDCKADQYYGIAVNTSQVVYPRFKNVTGDLKNSEFIMNGPWRFMSLENCSSEQEVTYQQQTCMGGDRGCGNFVAKGGRHFSRGDYRSFVHMNEGTHDILLDDIDIICTSAPDNTAGIYNPTGRGYRHRLHNVRIVYPGCAALVSGSGIQGYTIDGCDLTRDDGLISVGIDANCSDVVLGAKNKYGNGMVFIHRNPANAVKTQETTVRQWVYYTDSEVTLVELPSYMYISSREVLVLTPFNGTTPKLNIGYGSSPEAIAGDVSLSAQDILYPDPLDYAQWLLDGVPRTIKAFVTPGGSTAGKALVSLTYGPAPLD